MEQITIHLEVLGEPKAQARHRHFRRGKFSGSYDPSSEKKETFASILHKDTPEKPLDEPLSLELIFYMSRPKNHYRTGKNNDMLKDNAPEYHSGRPDLDNLVKFVQDALNTIYYKDDALIACLSARKIYSERPRTEILIKTI